MGERHEHQDHHHHHHHHHLLRGAHSALLEDVVSSSGLGDRSVPEYQPPEEEDAAEPLLNWLKRSPAQSDSSSKTCGPDDDSSECQRPVSSTTTKALPIALGVAIPVTVAIIILVILHRRQVLRMRREDAADKHNSADFGLEHVPNGGGKKGKKGNHNNNGGGGAADMPNGGHATMAETEKSIRRGERGMSMDMPMSNPYFLPAELQGSQESFHSLSRTFHGRDDKYRGATAVPPRDDGSSRSFPTTRSKPTADDGSSYTASSSKRQHRPNNNNDNKGDDMNRNLLRNAQRMSKALPPPPPAAAKQTDGAAPYPTDPASNHHSDVGRGDRSLGATPIPKNNNNNDGPLPNTTAAVAGGDAGGGANQLPPRDASLSSRPQSFKPYRAANSADMGPHTQPAQPNASENHSPQTQSQQQEAPQVSDPPRTDDHLAGPGQSGQRKSVMEDDIYDQYGGAGPNSGLEPPQPEPDRRRMTMGLRPLPPEDPADTPEQRANRIRSFYKEYFDDSKPFNEGDYYNHYDYGDYYGDYGDYGGDDDYYYGYDYYGDLHWQDPMADEYGGGGAAPFAQPPGRRAMTPPPRMGGRPGPRKPGAASAFGHHNPGFGSMSSGPAGGPRAFSSASGGRPPGGGPRKPRPPPAPLHELPTPHKLKDENNVLPIDYAPANGARERQAGRPGTPQGGLRPYSPAVPAHSPLTSAYDDLAAMPSPYALRKSGTFTALDFAPPPRFRDDGGTASDSGSIRSNRSGALSPAQVHTLRSGANRVSRLPTGTVGTKNDITSNLHPSWNMHR